MDRKPLIRLSEEGRLRLKEIVRERRGSVSRIRRAKILLDTASQTDNRDYRVIAQTHSVGISTVAED